jgi:prephenate dehydratase
LKRVPAEDTAGSVRDVLASGDKSAAGIAGRPAAIRYGGVILSESIQDNAENFTRFVLLVPLPKATESDAMESSDPWGHPTLPKLFLDLRARQMEQAASPLTFKMSIALRLAHKPGALLAAGQFTAHLGSINFSSMYKRNRPSRSRRRSRLCELRRAFPGFSASTDLPAPNPRPEAPIL